MDNARTGRWIHGHGGTCVCAADGGGGGKKGPKTRMVNQFPQVGVNSIGARARRDESPGVHPGELGDNNRCRAWWRARPSEEHGTRKHNKEPERHATADGVRGAHYACALRPTGRTRIWQPLKCLTASAAEVSVPQVNV